jgi:DNA mismatch repair protein MSH2
VEFNFRRIPDLEKISTRLRRVGTKSLGQKANLEDLVSLYHAVNGAAEILMALETYSGNHKDVLQNSIIKPLRACIGDFHKLRMLVEQTIDLKQAEQRTYCINSSFDASLRDLAAQRDGVREKMEAIRKEVQAELGLATKGKGDGVAIEDVSEGKALRVTKKFQQVVQNAKGKTKYKTLSIKKQEFIFTTPELENVNQRFKEAVEKYDKQSQQLVNRAVAVAATYRPVADRLGECLGELDVLAAFARAALAAPCQFVRAKLDPEGTNFEIQGATHVLVVANSDKSFVANDLNMERETSRLHLITGPNMGGKSTYIRSVALIALMNQIGSFVPCRSAVLPVFDSIMCRVGASDMQLRGISTFMAEMLEASCILNTATSRSLVIVDELGRGTSTSDGFGIAWAIAKHLVEKSRCFTLFATHFHELAALEDMAQGVRNRHATAAVDAVSGRLTFLYSLADGAADESYGGHCAELAGFPAKVVESARRRAADFEAGSDFGATGKLAKRTKTHTSGDGASAEPNANSKAALAYVWAARDDHEFAKRAIEKAGEFAVGCH